MLVNRFAVLAATLSSFSVCWATYPNVESMVNNVPANAIITPYQVSLKDAVLALPEGQRVVAWQSLSPLADGSLMVASQGSMRQFYEAIDDRLRHIPKLCKDMQKGISSGDTELPPTKASQTPVAQSQPESQPQTNAVTAKTAAPEPTKTLQSGTGTAKAINADPMQSPLNPTIHKVEPSVQKVLLESWATQPQVDKKTEQAKKEADLAVKEADLAKKEAEIAKKEAEAKTTKKDDDSTLPDDIGTDDKSKDDKDSSNVVALPTLTTNSNNDDTVDENAYRCNGIWAQALGSRIDQKNRDDVLGYDAHLWGLIIGRDQTLTPDLKTGFAIGYQHARAYSDEISGSFMDIKRFQFSGYSRYDYWCCAYTQLALTGAFNRYDNKRKILIYPSVFSPEVYSIAKSDFTGWEYDIYIEEGFTWTHQDYQINPKLFLTYTHLTPEGYFEKDAGSLNLSVKYDDIDVLQIATGFKLTYQAQFQKAFVVPEGHIYYLYNVVNDKQFGRAVFVNTPVNAEYPFYTQGVTPEASNIEMGGALAVHSNKYVMIKLAYDVYWNRDYHRQQGYIQARYEWA